MRIDRAILAYELAKRGMRQKRLSELSGVSRSTVSAIACGKTIAPDTANKIADALDMPLSELVEQVQLRDAHARR